MMDRATAKTAVVNYRGLNAEKWRRMTLTSTVCLIVFFPLPAFWFLFGVRVTSESFGIALTILLLAALLSFIAFCISYTIYKGCNSLCLSLTEAQISMPSGHWSGIDEVIQWKNIERISVIDTSSAKNSPVLTFAIKDHQPIKMPLSLLSSDNLDKLVSSCALWSNTWARDESFNKLVEKVTDERNSSDGTSFTALWMEEAHRKIGSTPFEPLEPGAKLQGGRVKIVQALGSGGWSAIYLCQWKDAQPAILKEAVVPPMVKTELREKAAEQFQREAVLLAGLNHPQIAKVLDYFVEDGRQYMVLERVSGPNLRSYIKDRGAVSESQMIKWASKLAEVIEHLHTQEPAIIHRDITPENLVIDMKGSLVLIDFGSANEFVGTVTGTLVGKPSYISPEQFAGKANLQSDLYSLGAVMFFMLTGDDPQPLAVAHPRSVESLVGEDVDGLVADLTNLDAKARPAGIKSVVERLSQLSQARSNPSIS